MAMPTACALEMIHTMSLIHDDRSAIGKDEQTQKATYPRIWGIEESKHQAKKLVEAVKAELAPFGKRAIPLMAIADFISARTC